MNYAFTIIVPVYNEEENLLRVETELAQYTTIATMATTILLVNDGSKDNSLAMIKAICARQPHFQYLSFAVNCGLSAAIKAGFDAAKTTWVGYIDSDLQTDPQDFNKLLEHTKDHHLITGVRADRKDDLIKNM